MEGDGRLAGAKDAGRRKGRTPGSAPRGSRIQSLACHRTRILSDCGSATRRYLSSSCRERPGQAVRRRVRWWEGRSSKGRLEGKAGRKGKDSDAKQGAILDGFPRTVDQAEALQTMLAEQDRQVDKAVLLTVEEDAVVSRILGRLTCGSCNSVFHVKTNRPRVDGICDSCGDKLESRSDDNAEAIRTRLATYRASTEPVVGFYRSQGLLREVDGGQTVDQVFQGLQGAPRHP